MLTPKNDSFKPPDSFSNTPIGQFTYGDRTPHGIFSFGVHDNLIRSKGYKAIHLKHALNPKRSTQDEGVFFDKMDLTGFMYYDPKPLYLVQQNMKWEEQQAVQGMHGKHTAVINYTGVYEGSEERTFLRPKDLLILVGEDTGLIMMQELITVNNNVLSGRFPIYKIDYLATETTRLEEGRDFILDDYKIKLLSSSGMSNHNPFSNERVLSAVYYTKPILAITDTPRIFRTVWGNKLGNAGANAQAYTIPGSCVVNMAWLHPESKIFKETIPEEIFNDENNRFY